MNLKVHPKGYWRSKQNQRTFLESFARKNNILCPSDWGNISARKKLVDSGGITLLYLYDGSLVKTLQNVFKGNSLVIKL